MTQIKLEGLDEACRAEPGRGAVRAMLAWAILEATPVVAEVAPALKARLDRAAAGNATPFEAGEVAADLEAVDDHIDDSRTFADLTSDLRAMTAAGAAQLAVRCAPAVDRAVAAIVERALAQVARETGASADLEARAFFAREVARGAEGRWQALSRVA